MNNQNIYDQWKQTKNQTQAPTDFTENLMDKIYLHEQAKSKPLFNFKPLYDLIDQNPLAKLALILSGSAIGIARLAFIISMFLKPC